MLRIKTIERGTNVTAALNIFQEVFWIRSPQVEIDCAAHLRERQASSARMAHECSDGIGKHKFIRSQSCRLRELRGRIILRIEAISRYAHYHDEAPSSRWRGGFFVVMA